MLLKKIAPITFVRCNFKLERQCRNICDKTIIKFYSFLPN